MIVWILRGISGAGKSTFSKIFENSKVVSADFYHERTGTYKYDIKNVQVAHGWCLRLFVRELESNDCDHLIVDNTNIHLEYISPYVRLAQAFNMEFYIVEFHTPMIDAITRNVHGTPDEAIRRMFNAMAIVQLPKSWPVVRVEDIRFGNQTYTPGKTVVRRSDWPARDAACGSGSNEAASSQESVSIDDLRTPK